jgi:hypothetical protein
MPLDGQIWENEQYVVQLERFNTSWKMIMFSRRSDNLNFIEVAVYENEQKMMDLLKKMNLQPSHKNIVVRNL